MLIALFISCLSDPTPTQPLPATGDQTTKIELFGVHAVEMHQTPAPNGRSRLR